MGNPVTLDSDDVEVLLNAAAGIRKVEDALQAIRQDPAMLRIYKSGKIGQSLDRVNKARASAIREDYPRPPKDWAPSKEQWQQLTRLSAAGLNGMIVGDLGDYSTLRSFGLVVLGTVNEYVNWGDRTQDMIGATTTIRAKLTEEGRQFIHLWSISHRIGQTPPTVEEKALPAPVKMIEGGSNG